MEEIIELTWYEAKLATEVGVNRCLSSWAKGSEHAAGYKPKDLFDTNIKAAASEMAVAKYLGIYWDGSVNTYKSQPDLAPDIEVRMSMMVPPCLIIRPNDKEGMRYVLVKNMWVHGRRPKFQILGFQRKELMKDKWLTDFGQERPECWAVPMKELLPI